MGIAERREREKLQRQNDILDAAEKVFFKKGFKAATIDDVAEAAELSKGTIYLYFKSKVSLYLGIELRANKLLKKKFESALANRPDEISRLRAIGQAYFEFSEKYPDYFKAMAFFETLDDDDLRQLDDDPLGQKCHEAGMQILSMISDAVRSGIDKGIIRPECHPMRTAILLWATSNGVITLLKNKGEHFATMHDANPAAIIDDYFRMINHWLLVDDSPENTAQEKRPTDGDNPAGNDK